MNVSIRRSVFTSVIGSVVAEPRCIRVGTVSVVNGPVHCSVCSKVPGSMVVELTILKGRVSQKGERFKSPFSSHIGDRFSGSKKLFRNV